jgi:hypothetical protein
VEEVMVLDTHYRIHFQQMTAYGTPKGYPDYHDLGVTSLAYAKTELFAHRSNITGRELIWLEKAHIGTEVWSKVLDV